MIPTRSMTQSAIFLLPESLQLTFTFQIRFHIFPPLNTLFHIIFQIFPSLISMGEFAIQATDNFFKNRILSNDNKAIIEMSKSQILDSMKNLRSEAMSICYLEESPNVTFNHSLASQDLPSHRQWLSEVTDVLSSFVQSSLPGRERLSVAIGIAKMVKKDHHYKSFTEPLIEAITSLFNHLEFQSRTDLSLIHFTAFQDVYVRMCSKAIETTKLTSFGPKFSSLSFSQLLTEKGLTLLANHLSNTTLSNISPFRKQRIIRRLINHAQFQTSLIKIETKSCAGKDWSCRCNSRKVSILMPKIAPKTSCLSKVNSNKYSDEVGFLYLSEGAFALSATKFWPGLSNNSWAGLTKILQQPIIRIKNSVKGWLVSRNSVFFPSSLNTSIKILCNSNNNSVSSVLQLWSPGIFRIFDNCNYSTHSNILSVSTSNNLIFTSTIDPDIDSLNRSSFSYVDNTLSPGFSKMLESKFQDALRGEDSFQLSLEELKNQSWLKSWIDTCLDAALPTVIIFVSFLAAFIALYIFCCCCSTQRNASCTTNNRDALIPRVEKLENFFAFYVNEKFHELQNQDILEAAKNKTK